MNLALILAMGSAKGQIRALSDDDFKLLVQEMQTFIKEESVKRGLSLGH